MPDVKKPSQYLLECIEALEACASSLRKAHAINNELQCAAIMDRVAVPAEALARALLSMSSDPRSRAASGVGDKGGN